MKIDICNVIHHVSHTWGKSVSVTRFFGQPSMDSRLGLGGACSRCQQSFWCTVHPWPSFCTSVYLMFKHWCLPPLDVVSRVPYMGCNGIVGVGLHHCYLIFCTQGLQPPSCISNVYWATLTRNLVHHVLLFFWGCWGLDMGQEMS